MVSHIVKEAKEYVSNLLSDMEDKGFYFHNLEHTLEVYDRVSYLLDKEEINEEFKELVQLAALFHDSGLISGHKDHEKISIDLFHQYFHRNEELFLKERLRFYEFVEQFFPKEKFDFSPDKIDILKQLIIATIPQRTPSNKLEGILRDGDIDNIGREDFFDKTYKLKKEMEYMKGDTIPEKERFQNVYEFLNSMKFYTKTQNEERKDKLNENIRQVAEKLKTL